jgi:long-chain acyl-CoA synthetase
MNQAAMVEQTRPSCALPLYHIFALTVLRAVGHAGGRAEHPDPEPARHPGLHQGAGKYKVQHAAGGEHAVQRAAEPSGLRHLDFSGLKLANGGGMAVQQAVNDKWKAVTGVHIIEGYGLSETSPVATCNRCDISSFTGTIGLPIPSTEVAILDDDGKELPLGSVGEIAIRGPQVMAGYWNRPDETAKVMTPDGFFKSGDIGVMDESGYVKIVDRKKDMILVSGFNVYPNELEGVIAAHPGVLECAVIGVPDEHSGEAVKVFVVKKDPRPDGRTADGLLQARVHRLQETEVHRVPRGTAEDQRRQDPAPRAARGKAGSIVGLKNRRPREGGDPSLQVERTSQHWVPAFAGTTFVY